MAAAHSAKEPSTTSSTAGRSRSRSSNGGRHVTLVVRELRRGTSSVLYFCMAPSQTEEQHVIELQIESQV